MPQLMPINWIMYFCYSFIYLFFLSILYYSVKMNKFIFSDEVMLKTKSWWW